MIAPPLTSGENHVREAVKTLSRNQAFNVFVGWLRDELAKRDRENRVPGCENKTSEAQCLAVIVDFVAACRAPEANRDDEQESGG